MGYWRFLTDLFIHLATVIAEYQHLNLNHTTSSDLTTGSIIIQKDHSTGHKFTIDLPAEVIRDHDHANIPTREINNRGHVNPRPPDVGKNRRRLALLYIGKALLSDTQDDLETMLKNNGFQIIEVDNGSIVSNLKKYPTGIYVQGAGKDDVVQATKYFSKQEIQALKTFIRNGGYYLGICMGGFLTGVYGFNFFDSADEEFLGDTTEKMVDVTLSTGSTYKMYVEDPPYFKTIPGSVVLATFNNSEDVAAMVVPYGKGKVALSGPHFESDNTWLPQVNVKFNKELAKLVFDQLYN